jgi:tetratricopeptide (TPR) repeat protein
MPILALRSIPTGLAVLLAATIVSASGATFAIAQPDSAETASPIDIEDLQEHALAEAQDGNTPDALRDYQRALEIRPDWKEGRWNLGMLQYSSDRFAEARSTFQKVVVFAPNLGMAWALLGLSEYETADYDDALIHLEKAQSLGILNDDEIARVSAYHLGLLRIRASEFHRAQDLLMAAFGFGAVSPQVKIALGLALLRVPLLPQQLDPSREALLQSAGEAAVAGDRKLARLAALLRGHPDVPYLHYAYGLALAEAGLADTSKAKLAMEQFVEETRISPESPLPWIELSRLQLDHGNTREALKAAQKSVRLAPGNPQAHLTLAQALEAVGEKERAVAERNFGAPATAARPLAEQRILLYYANPHEKPAQEPGQQTWNRALAQYSAGQYAAAIADLKASLTVTPENGTGWALLGLSEFALKDFDSALIHLDRGAKLGLSASAESLAQARYTFGILLVHAGQFERGAEILELANDPAGPLGAKVEYALGLALLHRAEFPNSTELSHQALVSAAGHIESLLLESKYDEAFPQFKVLLKRYPNMPFLHYAYGTALIALSQFDQAVDQMQAERTISPGSELPLVRLASIALRRHDPSAAVTWARQALKLAPDSVEAHYLMGRASLEVGDLEPAIRELETAAKLSPASPETHFNLAKAYARAKLPQKAQQERDIFSRLSEAEEARHGTPASRASTTPREPGTVSAPSPSNAPPP